jgi:2'-5' RNA ligase
MREFRGSNFIALKAWLYEQRLLEEKTQSKKTEYGCVMLYSDIQNWPEHTSIIKTEDVYDDEFKDFGVEHHPHCTLLFGIHLDETDPQTIKKFMETFKSVEVTIDTISGFSNDTFDVVKYDIPVTPEIKKYHDELIAKFPNTQTFPDFHPHMTIAYVLPGKGKQYHKKVKPFKVKFNTAVYSFATANSKEKNRIKIKLD